MFYRLSCLPQHASRTALFHTLALTAILSCALLFNACGSSAPANGLTSPATTSGSNANANLTVSTMLPAATAGSSYNATVTVAGGTKPYSFAIASGALPQGVLLGTSGALSGTPAPSGSYSFDVAVSDSKGASKQQPLQLTVSDPGSAPPTTPGGQSGSSFSNVQSSPGWSQYGQGPPNFVDCSPSPCNGVEFSMTQGIGSPSMSGQATVFYLGGTVPYTDALFTNQLIGTNSSQGMPDADYSLVPSLHDFTYDVYFYGDNLGLSEALEFDINVFFNRMGFIFGHECRIAGGNEWDIWDNQNAHWKPTGIPCHPNSNAWNHVTIKVQRTSDDHLVYQSIPLNGQTSNLNWTFGPGSAPGDWHGITINYQMDGNNNQTPYKVYLDNLTFSYQ